MDTVRIRERVRVGVGVRVKVRVRVWVRQPVRCTVCSRSHGWSSAHTSGVLG